MKTLLKSSFEVWNLSPKSDALDLKSEVEALRTQLVASGVSLDSIGSLGSGGGRFQRLVL